MENSTNAKTNDDGINVFGARLLMHCLCIGLSAQKDSFWATLVSNMYIWVLEFSISASNRKFMNESFTAK